MDYVPITESLVFGPGSPLEQCVNIETLLDSVLESLEAFEVVATVDGDDFGGSPAPVIISSSDSKPMFSTKVTKYLILSFHTTDLKFKSTGTSS